MTKTKQYTVAISLLSMYRDRKNGEGEEGVQDVQVIG
jgi:hypothetical protein